ncbi:MAG: HipA domain-containing protein [Desulfocurvibacter africanus]
MSTENGAYVFVWRSGGFVPAGVLYMVEEGEEVLQCRFQYEPDYLRRKDAVPLDPMSLPLSVGDAIVDSPSGFRIFPSFLDQMPDAWGQRVLGAVAAEKNIPLTYFDLIVSGAKDRIGALAYGDTPDGPRWDYPLQPGFMEIAELDLETLLEAAERFQAQGFHDLPRICKEYLATGSSVGGARPKSLCMHRGRHAVAKFKAAGDDFNVCRVEYATMRLAAALGLRVPEVSLVSLDNGQSNRDIFIVERFDRSGNDRVHIISAATAIRASTGLVKLGTYSYQDIVQALNVHGAPSHLQADRMELFRRMVFNMLVANEDDHLRNHSFLHDGTGWRLSPLYDVVPGFHGPRHLYLSAGTQGGLMSLSNALSKCEAFGLYRKQAKDIVGELVAGFVDSWERIFLEAGVPPADMSQLRRLFDCARLADRETDPEARELLPRQRN